MKLKLFGVLSLLSAAFMLFAYVWLVTLGIRTSSDPHLEYAVGWYLPFLAAAALNTGGGILAFKSKDWWWATVGWIITLITLAYAYLNIFVLSNSAFIRTGLFG